MAELQALLLILGCTVGLFLLTIFSLYMDKRAPSEDFDERQQLQQGKAAQFSFNVSLIYFLVAVCIIYLQRKDGNMWIEPELLVIIGLVVMVTSNHFYCLLTHSFLPLGNKGIGIMVAYAALGMTDLIRFGWSSDYWQGMPLTGQGSVKWWNLILGVNFLILALMHLFVRLRKEKE